MKGRRRSREGGGPPLAIIGWTHRKRGTEGAYRHLAVRFVIAKMAEWSCRERVATHASRWFGGFVRRMLCVRQLGDSSQAAE